MEWNTLTKQTTISSRQNEDDSQSSSQEPQHVSSPTMMTQQHPPPMYNTSLLKKCIPSTTSRRRSIISQNPRIQGFITILITILTILIQPAQANAFRIDFDLTASDDDKGVAINWFDLSLYSSRGSIPSDCLPSVRESTIRYLDEHLSILYDNFSPEDDNLNLTVQLSRPLYVDEGLHHRSRRRRRRRHLIDTDSVIGSIITFSGDVNFDYQPAQSLSTIATDINGALNNLTASAKLIEMLHETNDPYLVAVDGIAGDTYQTPSPTPTPTSHPTLHPSSIPTSTPSNVPSLRPSIAASDSPSSSPSIPPGSNPQLLASLSPEGGDSTTLIITSLVVGAAFISFIAVFTFRRRRRPPSDTIKINPTTTLGQDDMNCGSDDSPSSHDEFVVNDDSCMMEQPSNWNRHMTPRSAESHQHPLSSPRSVHNSVSATEVVDSMTGGGSLSSSSPPENRRAVVVNMTTLGIGTSKRREDSPSRSALTTAKAVSDFLKIKTEEREDFTKDMVPLPFPWDPSEDEGERRREVVDDGGEMESEHSNATSRPRITMDLDMDVVMDMDSKDNSFHSAYQDDGNKHAKRKMDGSITSRMSTEEFEEDWEDLPFHWDPVEDNPDGIVIGAAVVSPRNKSTPSTSPRSKTSPKNHAESHISTPSMTPHQSPASTSHTSAVNLSGAFPRLNPDVDDSPLPPDHRTMAAESTPHSKNSSASWQYVGKASITSSSQYDGSVMHPLDWSNKSGDFDGVSQDDNSTISETAMKTNTKRIIAQLPETANHDFPDEDNDDDDDNWDGHIVPWNHTRHVTDHHNNNIITTNHPSTSSQLPPVKYPPFHNNQHHNPNPNTTMSVFTGTSTVTSAASSKDTNKQFINDLVWLEKRIAEVRSSSAAANAANSSLSLSPDGDTIDDGNHDEKQHTPTSAELRRSATMSPIMQSIVCRDCFAPPGLLNIIIHSTKDGPSVHSVQEGSSLEGQLFAGDLIVAVDNKDTRSLSADQVMRMMQAKSACERKITVLHFEDGREEDIEG